MSDSQPSAIESRQAEVAAYDQNIAVYEQLLVTLPSEWPARLEQFRGRPDHQQAARELDDPDDVTLLAQLLFRDQVQGLLASERLERTKSASILAALLALQP